MYLVENIFPITVAVGSILIGLFKYIYEIHMHEKDIKMINASKLISTSVISYLLSSFKKIFLYSLFISIGIFYCKNLTSCILFLVGVILSQLLVMICSCISINSNCVVATSAKKNFLLCFNKAFTAGFINTCFVMSFNIIFILIFRLFNTKDSLFMLAGLTFSSFFTRLTGGIFTKSADISGDLVGKNEQSLSEDSIENPACIADNAGDVVGDCSASTTDFIETYITSIIMCSLFIENKLLDALHPFKISIMFHLCFIISCLMRSLTICNNVGRHIAFIIFSNILLCSGCIFFIYPSLIYAYAISILLLFIIFALTGYFTYGKYSPTSSIANISSQGSALNILQGLYIGDIFAPILITLLALPLLYFNNDMWLIISIMSSASGYIYLFDNYGPIADTAGGIASMSENEEARMKTDKLDEIGNSTKSISKIFMSSINILSTLLLAYTFIELRSNKTEGLIIGLFLGAFLLHTFSSFIFNRVINIADLTCNKIRNDIKNKSIHHLSIVKFISNQSISCAFYAILLIITSIFPLILIKKYGCSDGYKNTLSGFLLSVILFSIFKGISMIISGSMWDNAKKKIEEKGDKNSYYAAVTGDTVGDPFKDTVGPSLILLCRGIVISLFITNENENIVFNNIESAPQEVLFNSFILDDENDNDDISFTNIEIESCCFRTNGM